jgi:hypothetical protein
LPTTIPNSKKRKKKPLYEYSSQNNTKYDNKYSGIRGLNPVMRDKVKKFLLNIEYQSNDIGSISEEGEEDSKLNWEHIL